MKLEKSPYLSDVDHSKTFLLKDGKEIRNLYELGTMLRNDGESHYSHHVHYEKNDFANWVEEVVGDIELGLQMRGTDTLFKLSSVVDNRITHHELAPIKKAFPQINRAILSSSFSALSPDRSSLKPTSSRVFSDTLSSTEISWLLPKAKAPASSFVDPDFAQYLKDVNKINNDIKQILTAQAQKDPVEYYNNLIDKSPSSAKILGKVKDSVTSFFNMENLMAPFRRN